MHAIRSKGAKPFRRDGIVFQPNAWTLVDNPTPSQLTEPMLHAVAVDGPQDPRVKYSELPVLGATDAPAPETPAEEPAEPVEPAAEKPKTGRKNAAKATPEAAETPAKEPAEPVEPAESSEPAPAGDA